MNQSSFLNNKKIKIRKNFNSTEKGAYLEGLVRSDVEERGAYVYYAVCSTAPFDMCAYFHGDDGYVLLRIEVKSDYTARTVTYEDFDVLATVQTKEGKSTPIGTIRYYVQDNESVKGKEIDISRYMLEKTGTKVEHDWFARMWGRE